MNIHIHLFSRAQYEADKVNTRIANVELDTASVDGSEVAAYVEQCRCPKGYTGLSCEKCAPGFQRDPRGPWKGTCQPDATPQTQCPAGSFLDSRGGCQTCPCPLSTPSNR